MYSARYCCLILGKYGFPRQIFVTVPKVKFQDNPSVEVVVVQAGRQTGTNDAANKRLLLFMQMPPKNRRLLNTKKDTTEL